MTNISLKKICLEIQISVFMCVLEKDKFKVSWVISPQLHKMSSGQYRHQYCTQDITTTILLSNLYYINLLRLYHFVHTYIYIFNLYKYIPLPVTTVRPGYLKKKKKSAIDYH